ncbi:hypothetical protein yc1106_03020 [Curvularia clavata]|uniref:Uncharacterized protein n=1 Tax=Curvularia clavata TaxID=95742 RepID=A0A9Q8Z3V0_CURCL|nr:hypothetical protein yc1106_03020 [Curvularia clavata]
MPSVIEKAGQVVDSVGFHVRHAAQSVEAQFEATTNQLLPRTRREHMVEQAHDYARRNPKTAAFLATQAALAGLPLVLFLAFTAATLLISLTTCLLLGLIVSLTITFFVVSFALLFVVPTVFIASCSATLIFIWGFVGYIVLRKFNERGTPANPDNRIGGRQNHNGPVRNGHAAGSERTHANHGTNFEDNPPVNGAHRTVEWERKWADGVKPDQVVLQTDNTYEALKPETQAPSVQPTP